MFGSDSGFTPTDVGAEPFFSPEGPKMAIKLAGLDFAPPDGCECDPFFSSVGLSKPNMVIFSLFYKFDGQLKPMGMSAGAIFSPDY
jgi:hypothetical protein